MRDWEATLQAWGQPPSTTEQQKMENAEKAIRDAIAASPRLAPHQISIIVQGSYRNNTNVRHDSDVDISVVCTDVFFNDWSGVDDNAKQGSAPSPAILREAGVSDTEYTYKDFKNDVGAALVSRFGAGAVHRGDKAFDVHETSYRVDSDVVAALEHRRWSRDPSGRLTYIAGIQFLPDSGGVIANWPEQQYANGVAKNTQTNRAFKRMVRVLKSLRNEMADKSIEAAEPIPSYLVECLVFNAPNSAFGQSTHSDQLREVVRSVYLGTKTEETCSEWGEVNELKYLFRPTQPWTREQATAFLVAAWNYMGYGGS